MAKRVCDIWVRNATLVFPIAQEGLIKLAGLLLPLLLLWLVVLACSPFAQSIIVLENNTLTADAPQMMSVLSLLLPAPSASSSSSSSAVLSSSSFSLLPASAALPEQVTPSVLFQVTFTFVFAF